MRRIQLVLITLLIIITAGCIQLGLTAENIARAHSEVKTFLEDYPNAKIVASLFSDKSIKEECDNSELPVKDYWRVKIEDPDTDAKVTVWIDMDSQQTVCILKEGLPTPAISCIEDWRCSVWSECVNKVQTRTCNDVKNCGTTVSRPSVSRSCTVTPPSPIPYVYLSPPPEERFLREALNIYVENRYNETIFVTEGSIKNESDTIVYGPISIAPPYGRPLIKNQNFAMLTWHQFDNDGKLVSPGDYVVTFSYRFEGEYIFYDVGNEFTILPCKENWTCTEWSYCMDGNQTRTCIDNNECGTTVDKPEESQDCTSTQPYPPPHVYIGEEIFVGDLVNVYFDNSPVLLNETVYVAEVVVRDDNDDIVYGPIPITDELGYPLIIEVGETKQLFDWTQKDNDDDQVPAGRYSINFKYYSSYGTNYVGVEFEIKTSLVESFSFVYTKCESLKNNGETLSQITFALHNTGTTDILGSELSTFLDEIEIDTAPSINSSYGNMKPKETTVRFRYTGLYTSETRTLTVSTPSTSVSAVLTCPSNITFYPIDDSYVESDYPTENHGTESTLLVGNRTFVSSTRQCFSYLKFNLSSLPDNAIIQSTELWIYAYVYFPDSDKILAGNSYCSDNDWTETTINWDNKPSCETFYKHNFIFDTSEWYSWDVKEHTQTALSNRALTERLTVVGWEPHPSYEGSGIAMFYSKETTTGLKPKLIVNYTV